MNYKEVTKTQIFKQSWKKDDFLKNEGIRRSDCVSTYWKTDLEMNYGSITKYKLIKWLPNREYVQNYINSTTTDDIIEISTEIQFTYKEYTGNRIGKVLVHQRKIENHYKIIMNFLERIRIWVFFH